MTLLRFYRRLRALITGRRICTATFHPSDAYIYDKLLPIDPRAAASFAVNCDLATDDDSQGSRHA